MSSPSPLTFDSVGKHTATVIVAHGLGDSGAGWSFLAEQYRQQHKFDHVKFVFPNAPSIPITINAGMRMPGWYDITSFSTINRSEDEQGIIRSQKYFHELIKQEVDRGISSERIVLGGFSQGGAMSLLAGSTCSHKLGGIFGLSCYLLLQAKLQHMIVDSGNTNQKTHIFMGHGTSDQVVLHKYGRLTADKLQEWGHSVDFRSYVASPEELADLEKFLNQTIP